MTHMQEAESRACPFKTLTPGGCWGFGADSRECAAQLGSARLGMCSASVSLQLRPQPAAVRSTAERQRERGGNSSIYERNIGKPNLFYYSYRSCWVVLEIKKWVWPCGDEEEEVLLLSLVIRFLRGGAAAAAAPHHHPAPLLLLCCSCCCCHGFLGVISKFLRDDLTRLK